MLASVRESLLKNDDVKTYGQRLGHFEASDRNRILAGATIYKSLRWQRQPAPAAPPTSTGYDAPAFRAAAPLQTGGAARRREKRTGRNRRENQSLDIG